METIFHRCFHLRVSVSIIIRNCSLSYQYSRILTQSSSICTKKNVDCYFYHYFYPNHVTLAKQSGCLFATERESDFALWTCMFSSPLFISLLLYFSSSSFISFFFSHVSSFSLSLSLISGTPFGPSFHLLFISNYWLKASKLSRLSPLQSIYLTLFSSCFFFIISSFL